MIEVIYFGPAGVHRAFDAEGTEHALPRGVPTGVPDELAERLVEREHFAFADDYAEPTADQDGDDNGEQATVDQLPEDPPETGEHELPEDPEGVNATHPYVEE